MKAYQTRLINLDSRLNYLVLSVTRNPIKEKGKQAFPGIRGEQQVMMNPAARRMNNDPMLFARLMEWRSEARITFLQQNHRHLLLQVHTDWSHRSGISIRKLSSTYGWK